MASTAVRVSRVHAVALAWTAAYGGVRVWFSTGQAPTWKLPGRDLLVPDWIAVAACLVSAAALIALGHNPRSKPLIRTLWILAAGWVVVSAFALLDVVAALFPGLGIPFDALGMLSRFTALAGAVLLGATALNHQRRLDPTCLRCTGQPRLTETPNWALTAAWLAVAGCLTRLAAQAVVGFDAMYDGSASQLAFEGCFVLAGVALPLLLVYRQLLPRWLLLAPGATLGAGITAYFGVGLLQMIANVIQGKPAYGDVGLPEAFFWVAVPAYLVWGVGLAVATYAFQLRTRRPCSACGR